MKTTNKIITLALITLVCSIVITTAIALAWTLYTIFHS
jgi:hypothetical protein